ncbi:hypothetical protein WA026_006319 [Henosepilachna vigintioctopunctata]|uniref:Uncharacterized protein n=1 Tax=Henosepilachna vigintioctopunctata TaxID=420089 RepID=A0AAW1TPF8_9CUCU
MFGFKFYKYIATRRLRDRIERIQRRYPGHHLPPKEIAYSVLGAINNIDESNWSSLHYSAYLGMEETCFKLLKSGADLNLSNDWGDTPLHLACRMVFECFAKHLIVQHCCGLSVNLEHLEEVCNSEIYLNFKKTCEEEIQLLKRTFAGESTVTYYDILVSSTHTVARYLFNSDILAALREFDMGSSIFGSLLLKKNKAALKRYYGIKLGIVATRKIFPFLPNLCIDKLMEYLDIDDLNNFDMACSFRTSQ